MTMINSTSDDRTKNNSTRLKYRILSDQEKDQMHDIKDRGAAMIEAIAALAGVTDLDEFTAMYQRDLELARAHIEDAVMRAVRFITR